MNRSVATIVGGAGFIALLAAAYFWFIPAIETDLTIKAERELLAADISLDEDGATVDFDGRIGTVTGADADAGLSAVRSDVPGAVWNKAEVREVATPTTTPPPEPTITMMRQGTRTVVFEGVLGTEREEAAFFGAAEAAGLEVVDNVAIDEEIETDTSGIESIVEPLLVSADESEFSLDGNIVEVAATAKDPVEAEIIEGALDSVEADGWEIDRDLDVVVLPESVQIEKLQDEINQIFELAREIEGESPNFGTSDDGLNSSATGILDRVVVAMRRYPLPVADIVGHTDSIGDAPVNQSLSEERAQAVATYLTENGIGAERLTVGGRGETEPIADNETEQGRQENRRVNFVVGRSGN